MAGTVRQKFEGDPGPLLRAISKIEKRAEALNKSFDEVAASGRDMGATIVKAADRSEQAMKEQLGAIKAVEKALIRTSAAQIRAMRSLHKTKDGLDNGSNSAKGFSLSLGKVTAGFSAIFTAQAGIQAISDLLRTAREETEKLAEASNEMATTLGQLNQLGKLDESNQLVQRLGKAGAAADIQELGETAFQVQSSTFGEKDIEMIARVGAAQLVTDLSSAVKNTSLVARAGSTEDNKLGFARTFAALNEAAISLDFNLDSFAKAAAKAQEGVIAGGLQLEEGIAGVATLSQTLAVTPDTASERFRGFGRALAKKGMAGEGTLEEKLGRIASAMEKSGQDAYSFFGNENAAAAYIGLTKDRKRTSSNLAMIQGATVGGLEDRLLAAEEQGSIAAARERRQSQMAIKFEGMSKGDREVLRKAQQDRYYKIDQIINKDASFAPMFNMAMRGMRSALGNQWDTTSVGRLHWMPADIDKYVNEKPQSETGLTNDEINTLNDHIRELVQAMNAASDSKRREAEPGEYVMPRITLPERKER